MRFVIVVFYYFFNIWFLKVFRCFKGFFFVVLWVFKMVKLVLIGEIFFLFFYLSLLEVKGFIILLKVIGDIGLIDILRILGMKFFCREVVRRVGGEGLFVFRVLFCWDFIVK